MQNSITRAELHRKSIAKMKVCLFFTRNSALCMYQTYLEGKKKMLMASILQIDPGSVQDMHIYADPSCIPVLRIEQNVMVVPQHGSSMDFATDSSEPQDSIVPPEQREECTPRKPGGMTESGHVLRAVIFVHGFQVSFWSCNNCLNPIRSSMYYYLFKDINMLVYFLYKKTGASFGFTSCQKPMAFA
jgi:hypothetical protein